MRSVFMLIVGLVLGFALGAFSLEHFVAAPDRARAAADLDNQQRLMSRFDPTACSEQRAILVKQFQVCIEAADLANNDLRKCETAQASAPLPVPRKGKEK